MVAARSRHAGHVEPAGGELGRVAGEVAPRLGIDELVPRDPHLPAVVGYQYRSS